MKNFIQDGNVVEVTLTADTVSGGVVVVGGIVGVATVSGLVGDVINVARTGVYTLPKVTTLAVVAGDSAYVKATGEVTKTATDNTLIGVFLEPADASVAHAVVLLK